MGRPLRRAETVDGNFHTGDIGATAGTGEQIQMIAFVTGGSANNTTEIVQKGTKKFRCTTSDGTETCQLVAVASGSLAAGQCSLTATDSDGNNCFVTKITNNYVTVTNIDSTQFATGDRVLWVNDQVSPTENTTIQIVTA
jgi:hypothetical protein